MRCWFLLLLIPPQFAFGQHPHADKTPMQEDSLEVTSLFSPNLPMNRDGSGTSWQPDDSPMWMYMIKNGNTSMMIHGTIFLRYTSQNITNESDRGRSQFDAPNMLMFSLSQRLNHKNLVSLFSMVSFDPLTVGVTGYPLLFQTGEAYKGEPLVDKQHPHDLVSGLAMNYTHSFTKEIDVNTYFGYPGEPALGPVMFMHRVSAMNNPDAPLGHHWQDATHITFGTGTLGIRYKYIKAEGSIFTGREPDENRYDFDPATFDSYSYRISINPEKNIAIQFSQGFITSPESLHPGEDIIRTTASLIHTVQLNDEKTISSTLAIGTNSNEEKNLNSLLLESNLMLRRIAFFTRYEFVQKDAEELNLQEFPDNTTFDVQALSLGLNKPIITRGFGMLSAGMQLTINFSDRKLTEIYGNSPLGAQVYLKLSPPPAHVH